jgi:hypothetical protein
LTCTGVCLLCGMSRASKLCQCVDRRKDNDPFHEAYGEVLYYLEDIRFFGHVHAVVARGMVQDVRHEFLAGVASGKYADGDILKRIDRDAERLERRISGKIYGAAMRMQENPPKEKRNALDDGAAQADRIRQLFA